MIARTITITAMLALSTMFVGFGGEGLVGSAHAQAEGPAGDGFVAFTEFSNSTNDATNTLLVGEEFTFKAALFEHDGTEYEGVAGSNQVWALVQWADPRATGDGPCGPVTLGGYSQDNGICKIALGYGAASSTGYSWDEYRWDFTAAELDVFENGVSAFDFIVLYNNGTDTRTSHHFVGKPYPAADPLAAALADAMEGPVQTVGQPFTPVFIVSETQANSPDGLLAAFDFTTALGEQNPAAVVLNPTAETHTVNVTAVDADNQPVIEGLSLWATLGEEADGASCSDGTPVLNVCSIEIGTSFRVIGNLVEFTFEVPTAYAGNLMDVFVNHGADSSHYFYAKSALVDQGLYEPARSIEGTGMSGTAHAYTPVLLAGGSALDAYGPDGFVAFTKLSNSTGGSVVTGDQFQLNATVYMDQGSGYSPLLGQAAAVDVLLQWVDPDAEGGTPDTAVPCGPNGVGYSTQDNLCKISLDTAETTAGVYQASSDMADWPHVIAGQAMAYQVLVQFYDGTDYWGSQHFAAKSNLPPSSENAVVADVMEGPVQTTGQPFTPVIIAAANPVQSLGFTGSVMPPVSGAVTAHRSGDSTENLTVVVSGVTADEAALLGASAHVFVGGGPSATGDLAPGLGGVYQFDGDDTGAATCTITGLDDTDFDVGTGELVVRFSDCANFGPTAYVHMSIDGGVNQGDAIAEGNPSAGRQHLYASNPFGAVWNAEPGVLSANGYTGQVTPFITAGIVTDQVPDTSDVLATVTGIVYENALEGTAYLTVGRLDETQGPLGSLGNACSANLASAERQGLPGRYTGFTITFADCAPHGPSSMAWLSTNSPGGHDHVHAINPAGAPWAPPIFVGEMGSQFDAFTSGLSGGTLVCADSEDAADAGNNFTDAFCGAVETWPPAGNAGCIWTANVPSLDVNGTDSGAATADCLGADTGTHGLTYAVGDQNITIDFDILGEDSIDESNTENPPVATNDAQEESFARIGFEPPVDTGTNNPWVSGQNLVISEIHLKNAGEGNTDFQRYYLYSDIDDDGHLDLKEISCGTDPFNPAIHCNDKDGDGLSNSDANNEERAWGTQPLNPDSDGDGLQDGEEVHTHGTNPKKKDTDNDGIEDKAEIEGGTNATNADEDGDGLNDKQELDNNSNPRNNDTDNDGLYDGYEVLTLGTEPDNNDTDGDGLQDGNETTGIHNPFQANGTAATWDGTKYTNGGPTNATLADSDNDGIPDGNETTGSWNPYTSVGATTRDAMGTAHAFTDGAPTDPNNPDMDSDRLKDGREVLGLDNSDFSNNATNPLHADTDRDGQSDYNETKVFRSDPTDASSLPSDSDLDGLNDGVEIGYWGNITAHNATTDADGDGLSNGAEIGSHGTDPTNADTDGDGLTDGDEVNTHGTNPNDVDHDSDGLTDKEEVTGAKNPFTAAGAAATPDAANPGNYTNGGATDPKEADSDDDGIDDLNETTGAWNPFNATGNASQGLVKAYLDGRPTNPLVGDSDADGLADGEELNATGENAFASFPSLTNPWSNDTDGDELLDADEKEYDSNPLNATTDQDNDGLTDVEEIKGWRNPFTAEEGDHGEIILDIITRGPPQGDADAGYKFTGPEGPLVMATMDANGRYNGQPTSHTNSDTDSDGILDLDEITGCKNIFQADGSAAPANGTNGCDFDGAPTSPASADTDGDGGEDYEEITGSGNGDLSVPTNPRDATDNQRTVLISLAGKSVRAPDVLAVLLNPDCDFTSPTQWGLENPTSDKDAMAKYGFLGGATWDHEECNDTDSSFASQLIVDVLLSADEVQGNPFGVVGTVLDGLPGAEDLPNPENPLDTFDRHDTDEDGAEQESNGQIDVIEPFVYYDEDGNGTEEGDSWNGTDGTTVHVRVPNQNAIFVAPEDDDVTIRIGDIGGTDEREVLVVDGHEHGAVCVTTPGADNVHFVHARDGDAGGEPNCGEAVSQGPANDANSTVTDVGNSAEATITPPEHQAYIAGDKRVVVEGSNLTVTIRADGAHLITAWTLTLPNGQVYNETNSGSFGNLSEADRTFRFTVPPAKVASHVVTLTTSSGNHNGAADPYRFMVIEDQTEATCGQSYVAPAPGGPVAPEGGEAVQPYVDLAWERVEERYTIAANNVNGVDLCYDETAGPAPFHGKIALVRF